MKSVARFITSLILMAALLTLSAPFVHAEDASGDLKEAIDQKSRQLDEVTKQLQAAQISLTDTQVRGKTLKQEISRIDTNVKNANLNIQLSQLTIEKLNLEIQSVQHDIAEKESQVALKRESVSLLLQGLQEKEREGMLLPLLSGQSLAESLGEAQGISDLNDGLLADVDQLRQLKIELTDRLNEASGKKQSVEQKKVTLQAQKAVAEDQLSDRQRLLSETKSREDSYKKIVSDLEKQQQDISEEIGDIEDQLRGQYGTATVPSKRPGVFGKPIAGGIMTQKYGSTPYSKKLYKNGVHNGIDFGVPIGTPVLAAADGIIFAAGNNGRLQYGRFIVIKHDNGLSTLYGHLSRQSVKTGDQVKRGDIIGYSGNTGYAFGPHLHFGAYLSSSMQMKAIAGAGLVPIGYTLNPADYL